MRPIELPALPLSDGVVALRPFGLDDVPAVVEACQDPEIARYTVLPTPYGAKDAFEWIDSHGDLRAAGIGAPFAVVDASTGVLVGSMGLHDIDRRTATGEVGYWLAPPFRGLGFASRALRLLVGFSFASLDLARLELLTDVRNEPSQAVARRAGFVAEGVLRSARLIDGARRDMILWSRLPSDPAAPPPARAR